MKLKEVDNQRLSALLAAADRESGMREAALNFASQSQTLAQQAVLQVVCCVLCVVCCVLCVVCCEWVRRFSVSGV
jgi:hypothetical protein